MRGNITKRGKSSWRIKFDVGTDADGKRKIQFETVKGTKSQAQAALAKRLTELAEGRHVARTVETVETYAKHWIENIAPASRAPISVDRYDSIVRTHIIPGLGSIELQKLDGSAIDKFYASRRDKADMTRRQIHAVLRMILNSAVKAKKIARNPIADIETTPKAKRRDEIVVLDEPELGALLTHLRGHWLYLPTLVASATGMRRGEVLGLRWQDVDMAKGTFQLVQQVKKFRGEIVIDALKTKRSRRTIKVPVIAELERHRKEQLEQRLRLGIGGRPDLVFTSALGQPLDPEQFSDAFTGKAAQVKPGLTFHCLRHTHITLLLRSGVPVHIVSARAGHAKPSITLDAYCHLLGGEDNDAAKQAEAILLRVLAP
jgi:integrase